MERTPDDALADIFARQTALASFYAQVRPEGFYALPGEDRLTTWTRAIIHECCELDNELSWKPWKNQQPLEATRARRLDEMADILHFFVQLALDQGFNADDIYQAYVRKNAENRARQESAPSYRRQSGPTHEQR